MKITKKMLAGFGLVIISSSLWLMACQKNISTPNNPPGTKNISLYLTDDPCQYDSVFVDIRYVEIKIDTSSQHKDDDHYGDNEDDDKNNDHQHQDQYGKWDTLNIRPGVYNILKLRNGVDTLLAHGTVPAGKIRKIRLTLGINNAVFISGVSHPLNLLPGTNNYVYVKIHSEDEDDDNNNNVSQSSIWLDFNVCKSIKVVNGQYYLKPFIKPFSMQKSGRIEGKVLPEAAHPYVSVSNLTDSASALPEEDGEYKIRGLKAGIYSILFKGSNGYKDTTVTNVQVKNGVETHIPTIKLHQ